MKYPKYTVYGFNKGDRSGRVCWLLSELGIPYNRKELSFKDGDLDKPEYLKINPMGMVPAMTEDEVPMFESCAIMLYLAEKHHYTKPLLPMAGSPHRQAFLQWHFFAAATMDYKFNELMYLLFGHNGEDDATKAAKKPPIIAEMKHILSVIEKAIGTREYLVGGEFSAADISVGSLCYWYMDDDYFNTAEFPRVKAYIERLKARPAAVASGMFAS